MPEAQKEKKAENFVRVVRFTMTEAAGFEAPGLYTVQLEGGLSMAGSPISYSTCTFGQVPVAQCTVLTLAAEGGGLQSE